MINLTEQDVDRIRECVDHIANKAINGLPDIPAETWRIEYFYFSENIDLNGHNYVLSLKCSPPLKEDIRKTIMVRCEIALPDNGVALTIPVIDDFLPKIIEALHEEPFKQEMISSFKALFYDVDI